MNVKTITWTSNASLAKVRNAVNYTSKTW